MSKYRPYKEAATPTESVAETTTETATETTPKAKRKAKADEPTADEPLSTGGVIGITDEAPDADGNPEAAAPAKKSRKTAE